jgi:ribosomal protein S18 acetylase RimI-like enzyme
MAVVLRPFRVEDAAACGAIVGATPLWADLGLDATRAATMLTAAAAAGDTLLVLDVDGTLTGFAWIDLRGAFGRSAYLRQIAVAPAARSAGLGARLLLAFEAVAIMESPYAFLLVTESNHAARRFYERHGYDEVGRIPDYPTPGNRELLYRKVLQPA